jgi:shikimate kinase
MGTGKSVVGKLAAKKLRLEYVDSDIEIEIKHKQSISQIFSTKGEHVFRKMEMAFVQSGHPSSNCLISCGGGLPIQEGMIDILKKKGKVICLWASPETILERTQKNNLRPLLNTENPLDKIQSLFNKREHIYRRADLIISTDNLSPTFVAQKIQEYYLG